MTLPGSPALEPRCSQADCLSQVTFLTLCLVPQLLQQLKRLICDLCRLYNLPQHPDVEMLDQPLPAGPITQERKVPMKGAKNNIVGVADPVFAYSEASSAFQHVHSDEVTSEEEEEEEMGEVTSHDTHEWNIYSLMVRSHYILLAIDMLAAGHRPGPRPGPL